MDLDFIKAKIFKKDDGKTIQPGDYISTTLVNLLKQGSTNNVVACFAPAIEGGTYETETECSKCGEIVNKHLGKTKLLDYICGSKPYYCEKCLNEIQKEKEEKEKQAEIETKQQEINRAETIKRNTDWYIENYLDPNKVWNKGVSAKFKTNSVIKFDYNVDDEMISDYILDMDYYDFLKTPYWHAISLYAKHLAGFRCALCGSNEELRTHHKNYENHGYEHRIPIIKRDLIVLCNDCHEKFHEID